VNDWVELVVGWVVILVGACFTYALVAVMVEVLGWWALGCVAIVLVPPTLLWLLGGYR
jgi:hypothetical protein